MSLVREIVSLGRAARMGAKLKVRQPLAKVEVILADREHRAWLQEHAALIAEELNVKQVEFTDQADQYITYTVLPDLKRLGPRLGKQLPELKQALAEADAAALLARLEKDKQVTLELPGGPVVLDALGLASSPASQGRLGRGAGRRLRGRPVHRDRRAICWPRGRRANWCTRFRRAARTGTASTPTASKSGWQTDDPLAARCDCDGSTPTFSAETLAVRLDEGPLAGVEPVEVKLGARRRSNSTCAW